MLLDSNIVIYSALPDEEFLREFIRDNSPFVSSITRVEVLGFHKLTDLEIEYFESFFDSTTLLPISDKVISNAIMLRQRRKMALGDSIIAATTIVNDLTLVTRNVRDFEWIGELTLINPVEQDQ